jgi:hypothetical protein
MPRNRESDRAPDAASSGFTQRRRPLDAGETVPLPSNLLGQILALREAAKRTPPPRQDEPRARDDDFDPDLPD